MKLATHVRHMKEADRLSKLAEKAKSDAGRTWFLERENTNLRKAYTALMEDYIKEIDGVEREPRK